MLGRIVRLVVLKTLNALSGVPPTVKEQVAPGTVFSEQVTESPQESSLDSLEITKLKTSLKDLERKNSWYFQSIESLVNERDRWRKMFLDESEAHLSAQCLYEKAIVEERNMLLQAVSMINHTRKERSEPLLELPFRELSDPPVMQHEVYEALLKKLIEGSPVLRDYMSERNKVREA